MTSMSELLITSALLAGATAAAVAAMAELEADLQEVLSGVEVEAAGQCVLTQYAAHGYGPVEGSRAIVNQTDPALLEAASKCVGPLTGFTLDDLDVVTQSPVDGTFGGSNG